MISYTICSMRVRWSRDLPETDMMFMGRMSSRKGRDCTFWGSGGVSLLSEKDDTRSNRDFSKSFGYVAS